MQNLEPIEARYTAAHKLAQELNHLSGDEFGALIDSLRDIPHLLERIENLEIDREQWYLLTNVALDRTGANAAERNGKRQELHDRQLEVWRKYGRIT